MLDGDQATDLTSITTNVSHAHVTPGYSEGVKRSSKQNDTAIFDHDRRGEETTKNAVCRSLTILSSFLMKSQISWVSFVYP